MLVLTLTFLKENHQHCQSCWTCLNRPKGRSKIKWVLQCCMTYNFVCLVIIICKVLICFHPYLSQVRLIFCNFSISLHTCRYNGMLRFECVPKPAPSFRNFCLHSINSVIHCQQFGVLLGKFIHPLLHFQVQFYFTFVLTCFEFFPLVITWV